MLPKINQQNRNDRNIDPEVKEELKAGESLPAVSNQAAEEYSNLLNPSNEANQPRRKRPVNLAMAEKDYSYDSEDEKDDPFENGSGKNIKNFIRDDESDSSAIESEDKAAHLARKAAEALKKEAGEEQSEDGADPDDEYDVLNTGFYDKLPGTEKKKPSKILCKILSKKGRKV